MQKTKYYSYLKGSLPKGCSFCVKGEKLVLFITGLCSQNCFYCPISDQKKNKDVVFANERPVTSFMDVLIEAKDCGSKGAGITGGDPLVKINRTVEYIKRLKKEFGKCFHIHLYTPLALVNEKTLARLSDSGLDEIRFHPYFDDDFEKIRLARNFRWDVGVEIPVIPGKLIETKNLIDKVSGYIDFLNLNELEYSDTNSQELTKKGYLVDNINSYKIRDSEKDAKQLVKYCEKYSYNTHYCTVRLKESVQLGNRIKRQARIVKKDFDRLTSSGTLIRGAIYLDESVPQFGYRKKLIKIGNAKLKLTKLQKKIRSLISLSYDPFIDHNKKRVLISTKDIQKINQRIPNHCAIVEEYPTFDQFEIEVEILPKTNI